MRSRIFFAAVLAGMFTAAAQQTPLTPLESYLGMTAAQSSEIRGIEAGLALFVREKAARVRMVEAEIEVEKGRAPLDPLGFGLRYVEIETMRREIRSRAEARTTANRSVLTAEQRSKFPALTSAIALDPEIGDAACYGLVERPVVLVRADTVQVSLPNQRIPASRIGILPSPFGAEICFTPAAGPFSRSFTSEQRALVERISTEFRGWMVEKRARMDQVEREIQDLIIAPDLDAEALGRRYVEIETIFQEIQHRQGAARSELRATLSRAQIERIEQLAVAGALLPAAGQASCLGLLSSSYTLSEFLPVACGAVSRR